MLLASYSPVWPPILPMETCHLVPSFWRVIGPLFFGKLDRRRRSCIRPQKQQKYATLKLVFPRINKTTYYCWSRPIMLVRGHMTIRLAVKSQIMSALCSLSLMFFYRKTRGKGKRTECTPNHHSTGTCLKNYLPCTSSLKTSYRISIFSSLL